MLLPGAYREYTGASVSCREPEERSDACKVRIERVSMCVSVCEKDRVLQVPKCYGSSGDATGRWKYLAVIPKIILLFTGMGQI